MFRSFKHKKRKVSIHKMCTLYSLNNTITIWDMEYSTIKLKIPKLVAILDLCKLKCINQGTHGSEKGMDKQYIHKCSLNAFKISQKATYKAIDKDMSERGRPTKPSTVSNNRLYSFIRP